MQKTILIPTDFTIESLHTLRLALMENEAAQVRVVLVHACRLSNSITDLLFYAPGKIINHAVTPEFEEAISILKNRFFNTLQSLSIQLFHGNNEAAFTGFALAYGVSEIYLPKSYRFKALKKGFDPVPLINRTKFTVHHVNWDMKATGSNNSIAALFGN